MKRSLGVTLSAIFLLLFVLYAGFETVKYFSGPSLEVTTPRDLATFRDPQVKVTGFVARAAYININGKQIFADTKGYFETELLLPPGYSIIRVAVRDRFDKEVYRDLHLAYVPKVIIQKPSLEEARAEATSTSSTSSTTEETILDL